MEDRQHGRIIYQKREGKEKKPQQQYGRGSRRWGEVAAAAEAAAASVMTTNDSCLIYPMMKKEKNFSFLHFPRAQRRNNKHPKSSYEKKQ